MTQTPPRHADASPKPPVRRKPRPGAVRLTDWASI